MINPISMMQVANQKIKGLLRKDLRNHEKLLELIDTYYKVSLEPSQSNEDYGDKLTWCFEHCQGKFRDLKYGEGWHWYFERKEDATLFALRWR